MNNDRNIAVITASSSDRAAISLRNARPHPGPTAVEISHHLRSGARTLVRFTVRTTQRPLVFPCSNLVGRGSGLKSALLISTAVHPGPLHRGEGGGHDALEKFGRSVRALPRSCSRHAARMAATFRPHQNATNGSPSPGGEGRGEGGRTSIPFVIRHSPFVITAP